MAKKLWTVEMTSEVVVLAETREEAVEEARGADSFEDPSYHASEMSSLPCGWDGTCIPYGGDNDETIDELVEKGMAPAYATMRSLIRRSAPKGPPVPTPATSAGKDE